MEPYTALQQQLFTMQDLKYRDFHSRLLPGIDKETIIGIRTPILRKFAKEFGKTEEAKAFLQELPHQYYEENNLHLMIVNAEKDYAACLEQVKRFLPYINNWATCDLPLPKCYAKHKQELLKEIPQWLASGETYTMRYGMGILMSLYLDEDFKPEYLEWVISVRSEEYYVNMMIAWYLATALAKQWDCQRFLIWKKNGSLNGYIERPSRKPLRATGSTPEQKVYLRSLR